MIRVIKMKKNEITKKEAEAIKEYNHIFNVSIVMYAEE